MLKKASRIRLNKEFDRAFQDGQSFYGQILGLKAVPNGRSVFRLGILISTKVSKKAVVRNRFKRQIREIIRQELPLLEKGNDLVVIVFPQILDKNFKEIQIFLQSALKRLRLYN